MGEGDGIMGEGDGIMGFRYSDGMGEVENRCKFLIVYNNYFYSF